MLCVLQIIFTSQNWCKGYILKDKVQYLTYNKCFSFKIPNICWNVIQIDLLQQL